MKKEQGTLDELRERLRTAQSEVRDSASTTRSLKADFDRLRSLTGQLTQEHARLKESLRETHAQGATTTEAVRDVDKRLGPLGEMLELRKSTDTRLRALNSLAAHVLQKVKILDNQKHTVEHAVVEANRLNEMVTEQKAMLDHVVENVATLNETLREATGNVEATADRARARGTARARYQEPPQQDRQCRFERSGHQVGLRLLAGRQQAGGRRNPEGFASAYFKRQMLTSA